MERPDLLLGATKDHAQDAVMRAFWSGFDYAKEEVRRHFLEFIRTYCRQYDYDGLELDYFRHPLFFKLGEAQQNLDTMTAFVRKVRRILREIGQERGRPYLLAIRVPDTPAMARRTGLDVEQWMKEGLLDLLIVGGGYMPLCRPFRVIHRSGPSIRAPGLSLHQPLPRTPGHAQPGVQFLDPGRRRDLSVQLLRGPLGHGRGADAAESHRQCRTAQGLEPDRRSCIDHRTGETVSSPTTEPPSFIAASPTLGGSFP